MCVCVCFRVYLSVCLCGNDKPWPSWLELGTEQDRGSRERLVGQERRLNNHGLVLPAVGKKKSVHQAQVTLHAVNFH